MGRWTTALAAVLVAVAGGVEGAEAQSGDAPRLTVVLVADQMPPHLLERFDDLFTGGLRRLLDDGAVFTRARHAHGIPHTGPGHATLGTGVHPSSHGIVSNNWYDRRTGAWVYAAADGGSPVVGADADGAGRSPTMLERPTLGSALKAAYPDARVLSVAPKDRSAIFTAGHDADGAYWFDGDGGVWTTSAWYRDGLPAWVADFNDSDAAERLAGREWDILLDQEVYRARSGRDDAAYENAGEETTFPHPATAGGADGAWATGFESTPWLDELTLSLASEAVAAEELGADEVPDLLWVGLSAGDFIGHRYGPFSWEVQDQVLRLDRALGRFFDELDERLGTDAWAVALSADHGIVPMPEASAEAGLDAVRVPSRELAELLRAALDRAAAAEGVHERVPAILAYLGVYLGLPDGLAPAAAGRIRAAVAEALLRHPRVRDVVTDDELEAGTERPFARMYRRSRYPGRSPDLFIRLGERDLVAGPGITAHLSPYDHDVRVPLILAGPGVRGGRWGGTVETVDLAPTLAALLGLPEVSTDGRVLEEVLR